MKLVLAEKPSVAQSIAKVLGAAKREDGYLEGKRKRTKTHYRHHNTLFPKCLTGDCLNRNAGTIRLCVMPQGDKFQGVKTQER